MSRAIIISSVISAIATFVIAIYSVLSYRLSQQIKSANDLRIKSDDRFQEQLRDLYQAIVISMLLSGPSSTGRFGSVIESFKAHYRGKTPIFKSDSPSTNGNTGK